MDVRSRGFFPFSSTEIQSLKDRLVGGVDASVSTRDVVGRLLATVEWYQAREADMATRLGNSEVELDSLFPPGAVDMLVLAEDTDCEAVLEWSGSLGGLL